MTVWSSVSEELISSIFRIEVKNLALFAVRLTYPSALNLEALGFSEMSIIGLDYTTPDPRRYALHSLKCSNKTDISIYVWFEFPPPFTVKSASSLDWITV
jgi:hypothetical protein